MTTPQPKPEPLTPAQQRAIAKQRRHADAVAAGIMSPKDIFDERRKEFTERLKALPAADRARLNDWAARQAAQHGEKGVFQFHVIPWAEVFMVGRYGEEVEHWPAMLSQEDIDRLAQLENGGRALKNVKTLKQAVADLQPGHFIFSDDGPIGEHPVQKAPTSTPTGDHHA